MKQLSTATGVPVTSQHSHPAEGFLSKARRIWSATASFANDFFKSTQVAQMASVLSKMTDKQLAQIGVTSRSDIWRHAERLVR
ncbi:MAG: hypothetical protein ABJI96_08490 [Paracoccaceae bacterium]